ncbi:acyl-CoA thioesterase-1 [Amaricoccus macauensis]|uniref:Acyl-CoA thioesterase-1 n=1 Tax=Amaricoccus macauensis TaxID=57001 RepID=A0A840SRX3_9RHOB|nr:arylesterase [Amaricoccus macauensis]MBB5221961.1 acyl-CoA thioesterase-1 [Amaricoccus macauensis]
MRHIGLRVLFVLLSSLAMAPAIAEVRILAFGDSLTYGSGVAREDGFVPQLEAWLHAHGATDVVVLNAGVPGETTAEGRERIAPVLDQTRPDAVLLALGANDLLRGLSASRMFSNLDAILGEVSGEGLPALLAGLPAPPTWRREDRATYLETFRTIAQEHDAIFVPSFLGGMSGRGFLAVRRMMQPDGIHPNADGVRANVAAIGPKVRELAARVRAVRER